MLQKVMPEEFKQSSLKGKSPKNDNTSFPCPLKKLFGLFLKIIRIDLKLNWTQIKDFLNARKKEKNLFII